MSDTAQDSAASQHGPPSASPRDAAAGDSAPQGVDPAIDTSGVREAAGGELDRILEIPLVIHVELGRKRMRISEIMNIAAGTVVELETTAAEPLSIYANQTLIAQGEAVVVGERYGVRVTDIVSPQERVRRLGGKDES